jgi:hypothetical protein
MQYIHKGIIKLQDRMTIQRIDGEILYASRGYRVFRSIDGGNEWLEDGQVEAQKWRKLLTTLPLLRRISRSGIHHALLLADGSRLCIVSGMIVRAEAGSSKYRCVFHFQKGSRPLNLCIDREGNIYWGEYFLNLRRADPVRIFCSAEGGKEWDVIHTFTKGEICHIHRIIYDPYDGSLLICTGDRNHEVAILKTTDNFKTLRPIVQGAQKFRTAAVIPRKDCILYGTDNPAGENYIMSIDRNSCSVRKIQQIPGPVLYGCTAGERIVFSTMVEKRDHEVTLWCGDQRAFKQIIHLKTRKMNWLWREIAGYSTVILPDGASSWPYLYCTPVGTLQYNDTLIKIHLEMCEDIVERTDTDN